MDNMLSMKKTQINDVSRSSFAKPINMYIIRNWWWKKDNGIYYDNIWTWLLQQPLLWPTWQSTEKPLLCSNISCQIDKAN